MRQLISVTACCLAIAATGATAASALPPLACETQGAALVLTLAGDMAQTRTGDSATLFALTRLPQEHIGWPHAWQLTNDLTTHSVVVDELTCTVDDSIFPLRFYLLTQDPNPTHKSPALLHGCCTIAE